MFLKTEGEMTTLWERSLWFQRPRILRVNNSLVLLQRKPRSYFRHPIHLTPRINPLIPRTSSSLPLSSSALHPVSRFSKPTGSATEVSKRKSYYHSDCISDPRPKSYMPQKIYFISRHIYIYILCMYYACR